MKLQKVEVCAIALTLAFVCLAVGWQLGTRRRVPAFSVATARTEDVSRALPAPEGTADPAAPSPAETAPPVVDLNRAGAEELKTLEGVGDALAARIVAWREENGPFRRVEDITRVKGIGPAILERNLDRLTVGEIDEIGGTE